MNDIQQYTDEELSGAIGKATESLKVHLTEAYHRDASRKADDITTALGELSFAASALLGFVAEPPVTENILPSIIPSVPEQFEEAVIPETLLTAEVASLFGIKPPGVLALAKRGKLTLKGRTRRGVPAKIAVNRKFFTQAKKRGIELDWS